MFRPFKPNRALEPDVRVSAIENYLAALHAQLKTFLKTESRQVVRETVTEVIDSSTGGGGGSSSSGDATSIHGEPIDDTAPSDGDLLHYDTADNQWEPTQILDGRYSIGTGSAATAKVHIGAGVDAVGGAPFKLTAGTETSSAEDGAFEYDGTRMRFTAQTNRRAFVFAGIPKTSTTTVANTTTRTTVCSGEISANSLDAQQMFTLTLFGRYSTANGTDTFTLTAEFGNVDVLAFTSTAGAVTDAPVVVRFTGTVRATGASGEIWGALEADVNNASKTQTDTAVTVIDFGVTLDPKLEVTWSAADPGNTFSCDQAILSVWN